MDGAAPGALARARRMPRTWPRVALRATTGDTEPGYLLPEEELSVAGASAQRRAEFARGRTCARAALLETGVDTADAPLLPDAHGAVRWPAGTIGSITHTPGWTGAAAARRAGWGGVASLGLDAEGAQPLGEDVLDVVASSAERRQLRELASAHPGVPWSVVLFAAKEAVYKAVHPLTGHVLGHDDVDVALRGYRFASRAPSERKGGSLRVRGRWWTEPGVVVALGLVRSVGPVRPLAPRTDRAGVEGRQVRGV